MEKADKERYRRKLSFLFHGCEDVLDPYSTAEKDWVNTPSMWPAMEFGQVYTYLVDSPGIFTNKTMKAYKSLEAYNYYIRYYLQADCFLPLVVGYRKC